MKHLLVCIALLQLLSCRANNTDAITKPAPGEPDLRTAEWQRFHNSIDSIRKLLPHVLDYNGMNSRLVIVANLGIHSGLPRMILLDLTNNKIIDRGCVAHGYGKETFAERASFSNTPNSYCSSAGKYKVGKKYKGSFGVSYKLFGLDTSNSNAYKRFIVLHSYECVSDAEIYPAYTCNSQGCPMISPQFLKRLSVYIDSSDKPLLLWILPE
jgi:hypothetical protein